MHVEGTLVLSLHIIRQLPTSPHSQQINSSHRQLRRAGAHLAGCRARHHTWVFLHTSHGFLTQDSKPTLQAAGHAHAQDGKLPEVGAALEYKRAVRLGARDLVVVVVPAQDQLQMLG